MTAQQIADEMILCGQNLVIEELMRHDDSIWDSLQNFDENSEVLEWWLVTPYMAELPRPYNDKGINWLQSHHYRHLEYSQEIESVLSLQSQ